MTAQVCAGDRVLPALRQELELIPGAPNAHGAPQWLIYDPLRHRYFAIGPDETALLSRWEGGSEIAFIAAASADLGREVTPECVADLVYFLRSNSLLVFEAENDTKSLAEQAAASRQSLVRTAIHSYLFFRLPLIRPHRLLQRSLPFTAAFFSPVTWWLFGLMGLTGLYLVSRQWEQFVTTFLDFLSLEGLVAYGCAIVAVKVFHELGHAYTATRYGVRVTSMGVAFMVMMPLLYTDVTDAWRLQNARQRLNIAAAGIVVELGLACLATFLWAFLPDGPARSVAFVVATTSWLLSLAVNLNPSMKFDGYYLLADATGIANIQTRAFALARWHLRERLFDLRHPQPDAFSPGTVRALIAYAWAVWIYRLILFIGIALLVYHLFFKVLGVVLFAIEIIWFIALPIWREIVQWWTLRSEIMSHRRVVLTGSLLLCVLAALFVPLRWSVTLPAVLQSASDVALHAPRSAQVVTWHMVDGRQVSAGDVLAELRAPELDHGLRKTEHAIALLKLRLARIAGDDTDLTQRTTIEKELRARREERAGHLRQIADLQIRAAAPGVLRDVDPNVHPAAWVGIEHRLGRLVSRDGAFVRAYGNEDVLMRVARGDTGRFVPDDPQLAALDVRLDDISEAGADALEITYLASVHGGPVASERDSEGRIRPRRSQFVLRLSVPDGTTPGHVVRGVVRLAGRSEPLAHSIWRQVLRVLVRESGL